MDFGVIVDVETTGLEPDQDHIIEIGLLEFAVEDGEQPVITRTYGGLEDPGVEIPTEVSRITGIENAHVRGQTIHWDLVRGFFERASLAVAHNADFDRRFVETRPELQGLQLHWACSMRHIDWKKYNCGTNALNYLAADHGFVNPFAHRAIFDCATTFRLITPYLEELIERSYMREYMVKAVGSPFETKDLLKARGYRWDPEERCWGKVVSEGELAEERTFLAEKIYGGTSRHQETELS